MELNDPCTRIPSSLYKNGKHHSVRVLNNNSMHLQLLSANILLIINVLFNIKLFVTDTNYW